MRICDVIEDLAVNELLNMATGQYVLACKHQLVSSKYHTHIQ